MTIDKAITYFEQSLKNEQASSHTLKAYKQDLEQFCKMVGKDNLDDLEYEDFLDYLSQLSYLKFSSIRRKRIVLNRFLYFCYRKQFCNKRLYEYVDPVRHKKDTLPKEVLSTEEITKIQNFLRTEIKQCKDFNSYTAYYHMRNELLVALLLYTGCRAYEAVSIKKKDINLKNGTIILLTKGSKYNTIPIHEQLFKAFEKYYVDIEQLNDSFKDYLNQSLYLFPSRQDSKKCMSTRTLHDLMKKLSQVIQRPIHAHLFRHTFASYCIASNMDISTISSLISHSNPSITLSIYTHEINAHNKREQIKKLHFD